MTSMTSLGKKQGPRLHACPCNCRLFQSLPGEAWLLWGLQFPSTWLPSTLAGGHWSQSIPVGSPRRLGESKKPVPLPKA